MDYKEATRQAYDRYAREFEQNTKEHLKRYILQYAELFIANLSGKRILDLGSGPGRDALFFKSRGLVPLCFDISLEMVKLCQEKGLEAKVGDLEDLPFPDDSFEGVWAHTSLLHVPKNKFKGVLTKINNILAPKGILMISMKEGNFEGMIKSDKYDKSERFFALYQDTELRATLRDAQFNIIHTSKVVLGNAVFLNYLVRK